MQRAGYAAAALILPLGLVFFRACAASRLDIIQVGPWFPQKNWKEVVLFASREDIKLPWGGIAIIHGPRTYVNDVRGMEKQRFSARKMAAKAGADGLIIAMEPIDSGLRMGVYEEPEVCLSALAVKYAADVSTVSQK